MDGRATALGTAAYSERKKKRDGSRATGYRILGNTELTTSGVGFGCYRISNDVATHRSALEKALKEGCNLIDTSTNYADGESESCVGTVLQSVFEKGQIKREEVIVVSKVGYVQGHNLELAKKRESYLKPFPEMVKYMDGCWHCIHPDFIRDQLSRSLERTKLSSLDSYLLHNPEYFFSDAKKRAPKGKIEEVRKSFYDRVTVAFEALEGEVQKGRIASYGVSSNTFGSPLTDF